MFTANQLTTITVKDRSGTTKGVLAGKVLLRGGDGIRIDADGDELTLNAGSVYNEQDSRYQRKFEVILNGGTFVDDDGTVMTFTGMPYYLASMGGVKGDFVNNFDFLSNACGQVGIFTPVDLLSSNSESSVTNSESKSSGGTVRDPYVSMLNDAGELELLDICQACIDCEDYAQIVTLMDRIEEWQDGDVNRNLDEGLNLFRQTQAVMHFWNYLVHIKCLPLVAIRGNEIFFVLKSGYFNKGPSSFSPTQRFTFEFEWEEEVGEVEIKISDTKTSAGVNAPTVTFTKVTDTQYTAVVNHSSVSYNKRSMYELVVIADQRLLDASFEVTWSGTHLGESITKEREGLIA